MDGEVFGRTPEGETIQRFRISGGGLTAHVMNWGAAIQDLRLAGHEPPLVLGYDNFEDYHESSPYFGAVPGRYANRIANGAFVIDGRHVQTDRNFLGKHTLHGGAKGFGRRVWDVALHGPDFVTFSLHSASHDMGFPGAMDVTCTYRLKIPGTISVELSATAEEPTVVNLTNHSYFNLDDGGSGDTLDHELMIAAGAYLPVDDELIPTGVVQPVEGTPFDFQRIRPVRYPDNDEQFVYDHNFCLAAARGPLRKAALLRGGRSGVEMEVWTTEPGVQLYGGHKVEKPGTRGLGGRSYKAHAGLCLETQVWPDSPNRPYFPQAHLWPGERYHALTEFRFAKT